MESKLLKWEYLQETKIPHKDHKAIGIFNTFFYLNEMGKEGWELCFYKTYEREPGGYYGEVHEFIFKRPKV